MLDHGKYISGRYWPTDVGFKEPSRLTNREATKILEWWRDRQVTDPTNTFKVKKWLASDGSLQPTVANSDNRSSTKRLVKKAREGDHNSIQFGATDTLLDCSNEDIGEEVENEPAVPWQKKAAGSSMGERRSKPRDNGHNMEGVQFSSCNETSFMYYKRC